MLNIGGKGKSIILKKELQLQNSIDRANKVGDTQTKFAREIARRNNASFVEEILVPLVISLVPVIVFLAIISL